jgi:hypothetical protein
MFNFAQIGKNNQRTQKANRHACLPEMSNIGQSRRQ